jgi:hypothetical protein
MTTKNKSVKIVEPTAKKGSSLTASIREAFNKSVDLAITSSVEADLSMDNLTVLVQTQLNANKLVKNKKVEVNGKKELHAVIPFTLWAEYNEMVEYRQFINGGFTLTDGAISSSDYTTLKNQTSTTFNRLKVRLITAQDDSKDSKSYSYFWEKSLEKDSVKNEKLRKNAVADDKTPLLETMVANDCDDGDYEKGFAILNGERAKKKDGKVLGVIEQKAVIASIKADQVKADKIPDNEFKVFIKLFKGSTTAKKKEYMVTIHKLV